MEGYVGLIDREKNKKENRREIANISTHGIMPLLFRIGFINVTGR